jgi:hypothetical protein
MVGQFKVAPANRVRSGSHGDFSVRVIVAAVREVSDGAHRHEYADLHRPDIRRKS